MGKALDFTSNKIRLIVAMIGVLLATAAPINDLIVIPAGDSMFKAFPNSAGAVNFILSGPALIAIVSSIVTGRALIYFRKKVWLLAGVALFGVASICGILIETPIYMAIMRAIVGWSIGMIVPASIAIIAELFANEGVRTTMMGLFNLVMSLFGIIFSTVAGRIVANVSWEAVFHIYWFAVPLFVILFFVLPDSPAERDKPVDEADADDKSGIPWGGYIINTLGIFIIILITDVIYYMSSVYVAETKLGTAAFAGILGSAITIGAMVGCLIIGPLFVRVKNILPTIMCLVMGLAYFILGYWVSAAAACVACGLVGALIGMCETYYETNMTMFAPKYVPMGIGLSQAGIGLGMFLATYTYALLANILPSGASVNVMQALGYISLVCTVIALIIAMNRGKIMGDKATGATNAQ